MKSAFERVVENIEEFLKRHDMAPSRLGRDALNNPNFVFDLRERKINPTLGSIDKVYQWMVEKDKEL